MSSHSQCPFLRLAKGPTSLAVKGSRGSCLVFEKQDRAFAVVRVAIVIAVDEVRPDFAQVAWSDWLIAHHADGLPAGRPAVHQDEFHVLAPKAKQRASSPPRKWFAEATET